MPAFEEDPALLSKSRLISHLVFHNVKLPPTKSRKVVYVELYQRHIKQRKEVEFSSEKEEGAEDLVENEHRDGTNPEASEVPDPSSLTDRDLKAELLKHGVTAGPIVASTRTLYEKKLRRLQVSDGHEPHRGGEKDGLYSGSENEEQSKADGAAVSDLNEEQQAAKETRKIQKERSQTQVSPPSGHFTYAQCFLPPYRVSAYTCRNKESSPSWNSENALRSSHHQSSPGCSEIPAGFSRASTVDQPCGLGSRARAGSHTPTDNDCSTVSSQAFSITQMVEEMENRKSLSRSVSGEREVSWSDRPEHCSRSKRLDEPVLESRTTKNHSLYLTPIASPCNQEKKELVKVNRQPLYPAETTTNSRPVLNATCRRPIKWAAMHPMQRKYPDTPVSPRTWEKQEIDRRLVPIHVQIFFFLAVMCLLYLSYTWA